MSGLDAIRDVQSFVWNRFVYVPDSKTFPYKYDDWRDSWDAVTKDPKHLIRDDCDGLACTVIEGLLREGFPREDLAIALVSTTGSRRGDHLVGVARTEDGKVYVVGDTFSGLPMPISRCRHRFLSYMSMAEPGKVRPWGRGPFRADPVDERETWQ